MREVRQGEVVRMTIPDFINDGPDEPRTMTATTCPFCRGIVGACECVVLDFETHRRMLLEAKEP